MPEVPPFEGRTDPSEFLRVYETAIEAAGGDDTTKAKSISLALKGVALTWFFNIPSRSVYAWEQLRDLVRNNFQGNYAEPKDAWHLFAVKQAPGETLRSFFKKFTGVKAYDKIHWDFLEDVMVRKGFSDKWINWVMSSVKEGKVSININGTVGSYFITHRSLRLGDPFSPSL